MKKDKVPSRKKAGVLARMANSGLFMDSISCFLLSLGCLLALLAPTLMFNDLFSCFLASFLSVLFIVLLTRRWWLLPTASLLIMASYYVYYLWMDDLPNQILYGRTFLDWVLAGAIYKEGSVDASFLVALNAIIALGITAALFLLIRKLFFYPAICILQAFVLLASFVAEDSDLSTAVCMSAAGLLVLLPKVYGSHLGKQGRSSRDASEHGLVLKARMQAVAIPAAVFSVLLASWLAPQDPWQSRHLNTWFMDVGTYLNSPLVIPSKRNSNFHLQSLGYQPQEGRLGGPVSLCDEPYLEVWTKQPALLKGQVMDYYDGSNWSVSGDDVDMRLGSFLWNDRKAEAFHLDKPLRTPEAEHLYEQLTSEVETTVLHLKDDFNTLFIPENMSNITLDERFKQNEVYFNERSELYLKSNLPFVKYTVTSHVWNARNSEFGELFVQLEAQAKDPEGYSEPSEFNKRYLQLPEHLPMEVHQTAADITHGMESPYLKATAISRWLGENASYTLAPAIVPEDMDFIAHFLDTREGYCVYFATAMTVLARSAGLPARYVQGFALEPTTKEDHYLATGKTAHAWSEVYIEGIGWIPMDPLSWNSRELAPNNYFEAEQESLAVAQERQEEQKVDEQEQQSLRRREGEAERSLSAWLLLPLLLSLFGAYCLILWAGPRQKARMWNPDKVRRRWTDTEDQLDALYDDILRILGSHHLSVQPGETLVTFPKRVDRLIAFLDVRLAEIADALMRSHFGGIPPTEEEVGQACLYHENLESYTLANLGKNRYLTRRVLGIVGKADKNADAGFVPAQGDVMPNKGRKLSWTIAACSFVLAAGVFAYVVRTTEQRGAFAFLRSDLSDTNSPDETPIGTDVEYIRHRWASDPTSMTNGIHLSVEEEAEVLRQIERLGFASGKASAVSDHPTVWDNNKLVYQDDAYTYIFDAESLRMSIATMKEGGEWLGEAIFFLPHEEGIELARHYISIAFPNFNLETTEFTAEHNSIVARDRQGNNLVNIGYVTFGPDRFPRDLWGTLYTIEDYKDTDRFNENEVKEILFDYLNETMPEGHELHVFSMEDLAFLQLEKQIVIYSESYHDGTHPPTVNESQKVVWVVEIQSARNTNGARDGMVSDSNYYYTIDAKTGEVLADYGYFE